MIDGFTITGGNADQRDGGEVYDNKGGAIFVDYGSMATIEGCTFENNTSKTAGGAIYVIDRTSQSIPNETDFYLIDPTWTSLEDIFSSVLVLDSIFKNNSASSNGGAIYVYEGSFVKVVDTLFDGNKAEKNGGAIGLFNGSTAYICNTEFSSNTPNEVYKSNERSQIITE